VATTKIGLLTGGFFEFWRMYPGLEKVVEKEMRELYENLRKDKSLDVVWSGLADTLDKCDQAGRTFKKEDIDLLVICEGSYFPDFMPIQTMEHLPRVPVLILLTQPQPFIPPDMSYVDAIHHSFGLVGVVQLTGAMKKMGTSFEIIISSLDDESLCTEIARYAKVVKVYKELRFMNLGIVGHTFQGMYDLEIDKTLFKATIGPNVVYLELHELIETWKGVSESAGQVIARDLIGKYKREGPEEADITNACRLGIAMEKLAIEHRLDGLAHLCQHFLHVATGTTPCLPNAQLIDKGIMVTCEGDIGNLAMMCILNRLTGTAVHHGEFGMYDLKEDALLFVHHGAGSPALARKAEEVTITPTGEKWGFQGNGASFRYTGKPGKVTLASFTYDPSGWKMMIAGGEAIEVPLRPYYGEQFTIRFEKPVKDWLYRLCREGVTHHAALVYGDVRKELRLLADLLHVRQFEP
jgi:L-arabinose isomerase